MITINIVDDKQMGKIETEKILTINNKKNKNNENKIEILNSNICFLCKKEKITNFIFNFSFLFNYSKKSIRFNNEIRQELNEIAKNYYDILIQPCKCKLYCHFICLLQYCITNLSIKCTECLMNYNFNLKELNSVKIDKCVLFQLIVLLLFFFIFLLGGLFFLLYHIIKPDEYLFLNYTIGIVLIIISSLIFLILYKFMRNLKPQKKIFPIFIDSSNEECKNLDSSVINNNLLSFEKFLSKIFDTHKNDLVEKKMFNQIWITSKISRKKEIYQFIIENNDLLEKEEKIFEEMKANKQNCLSMQNVKRKSKLNGINVCYAEDTNINNTENKNDENNNNNLGPEMCEKTKSKNLLMLQRPSLPLIGLKCKSNRRLKVRGSFAVEKDQELINNINIFNDIGSFHNSSELSSIRECDLKNKKKMKLKTMLIHSKNKREEINHKKRYESDIKFYSKKMKKLSSGLFGSSESLFKNNFLEGENDINVLFEKK